MTQTETARGEAIALSDAEITREAGRIGAATMASRVLGLVRDMQFAALFGTSRVADAFNLAFQLPNTLRLALGEGAVRSAFVPVLSEAITRDGPERGRQLAARTLSVWTVVLIIVSLFGVLLAEPVVRLYAWGWRDDPESLHLAINLTRFLFPFILLAGMTALAGGVLNGFHRYLIPALSSIAFNILSIVAAYILCPRMGEMSRAIWGFAIGTMAGGIAALVMHFPSLRAIRVGMSRVLGFHDPDVRKMSVLLGPALVGLGAFQVNTLVDTVLATGLGEGAVTAIKFSQRVTVLPLGVFGLAVTTAALPSLSALAAGGDHVRLRSTLGFSLRVTFGIMAPTCLGLMLLAEPIVRVLFERGAFMEHDSTPLTARVMLFFAVGLPFFGVVKGLAQAFYAYQDTRTPFGVGIVAMVANIALNLMLMGPMGVGGLALATSLSGVINMSLLAWLLQKKTGRFRWRAMILPTLRILVIALIACIAARWVHEALWSGAPGGNAEIIPVAGAIAAAGAVYALLAWVTRTPEVTVLWESYLHRRGRR